MADSIPTLTIHRAHITENGGYSSSIVYIENDRGAVELEICSVCHFIRAKCEHNKNTWNEEGDALTCDLCGIDGT